MNIIAATRAALGLSQAEFGEWLAKQLSRQRPVPAIRVSEWERGVRSPRRNVRKVCAPVAAKALAIEIVRDVLLHSENDSMSQDELAAILAEKIERLIA